MEVHESIPELRLKIQDARKVGDTWYGRNIMRFFSIYITRFLVHFDWSPNQATLLSLVLGLLGTSCFSVGAWGLGILGINLWYLVDHVDGEIARYTGKTSLTGYFFDTVVNFFIQPLTFLSMGYGLRTPFFFGLGIAAAFGSLMLSVIPMCEDSILLHTYRKKGVSPMDAGSPDPSSASSSFLRRVFSLAHHLVTYPSFLCLLTGAYLFLSLTTLISAQALIGFFLFFYAFLVTGVWVLQLAYKIYSRKLDAISGSGNG